MNEGSSVSPNEADQIIRRMTAVWPNHTLTPDEAEEWSTLLDPYTYAVADATIDALRRETQFFPALSAFDAVAAVMAKRMASDERMLPPAPEATDCNRCGSTGWVEVEVQGGHRNTVVPCTCVFAGRKTPFEKADHPRDCTCKDCAYGPVRARAIRGGYDGGVLAANLRPVRVLVGSDFAKAAAGEEEI